ncbi:hypothetical protein GJ496_008890, partial [Pomphorhynchus laevis]
KVENWLKIAFNIYDTNGDGYLSRREVENTLKAIANMNKDDVVSNEDLKLKSQQIMTLCDDSKDGLISFEEFIAACSSDENLANLIPNSGQEEDF